jgi:hypothetical protein
VILDAAAGITFDSYDGNGPLEVFQSEQNGRRERLKCASRGRSLGGLRLIK